MIKTSKGYLFEMKENLKTMRKGVDANGQPFTLFGVKEEYTTSFKDNIQKVKMTFGIDILLNICNPTFYDANIGFAAIGAIINPANVENDITKFSKSNRAVYSVCPAFICNISGKLDRNTMQWSEDTHCNLYIQRTQVVIDGKEYVACDLFSDRKGLHTFYNDDSSSVFLEQLRNKILVTVIPNIDCKESFWLSRINVGG